MIGPVDRGPPQQSLSPRPVTATWDVQHYCASYYLSGSCYNCIIPNTSLFEAVTQCLYVCVCARGGVRIWVCWCVWVCTTIQIQSRDNRTVKVRAMPKYLIITTFDNSQYQVFAPLYILHGYGSCVK